MGTKNEPGQFDCYDKAEPDEPLFTLLARDPLAPHLVRLWTQARQLDVFGALDSFRDLLAGTPLPVTGDGPKDREAADCAEAMEAWREARRL